jgi:hypothetical protein
MLRTGLLKRQGCFDGSDAAGCRRHPSNPLRFMVNGGYPVALCCAHLEVSLPTGALRGFVQRPHHIAYSERQTSTSDYSYDETLQTQTFV